MQNKILFMLLAVVIMQLIYFLVKSAKDRFRQNPMSLKRSASIRAYIVIIALLLILLIFSLR